MPLMMHQGLLKGEARRSRLHGTFEGFLMRRTGGPTLESHGHGHRRTRTEAESRGTTRLRRSPLMFLPGTPAASAHLFCRNSDIVTRMHRTAIGYHWLSRNSAFVFKRRDVMSIVQIFHALLRGTSSSCGQSWTTDDNSNHIIFLVSIFTISQKGIEIMFVGRGQLIHSARRPIGG